MSFLSLYSTIYDSMYVLWPPPLPLCPYEAFSKVGNYVEVKDVVRKYSVFQKYLYACTWTLSNPFWLPCKAGGGGGISFFHTSLSLWLLDYAINFVNTFLQIEFRPEVPG